ncbi:MAG: ABC transporter permease, partial [Gemmatimonadales bacterium]
MGEDRRALTDRLYRGLVRLFMPRRFREECGEGMARLAHDLVTQARARQGFVAGVTAFVREIASLLATALQERRRVQPGTRPVPTNDRTRRENVSQVMGNLLQDARFAMRTLSKHPEMTLAAMATLALGIGANTAIFSVVNGVLLHPLSYPEPDRVVYVTETSREGNPGSVSYENFRDWQAQNDVFDDIALWVGNSTNVTGGERPERIRGLFVTASYFTVAGVQPAMGRAILPGEDVPDGARTAVLSHGFWQRRFGADPEILGKTIVLNNVTHTVVGVMPEGFIALWDTPDAWISFPTASGWPMNRETKSYATMARLKDGVTIERAQQEMDRIQAGLRDAFPAVNQGRGVLVRELVPLLRQSQRPTLLTLMAAAGMVLLIACVNVANLQLARATGRVREMGIRAALGGGRRRLVSQMLVENLLLAFAGGVVGLALSYAGVDLLVDLRPSYGTRYDVDVNPAVLAFGLGLSVLTGIAFGLAPAFRAARANPSSALGEGARGASVGRGATRLRAGLVVTQMGLAVMLLVGAGLLIRSLVALGRVDTGFDTENLLTLEFRLPPNKYEEPEVLVAFYDRMLARVGAVPGAISVASAGSLPFSWNGGFAVIRKEGEPAEPQTGLELQTNAVSPGYLATMGIPLLQGRGL